MKVNCNNCRKEFDKQPSQVEKSSQHYCSRSCAATFNNKKFPKRKKEPRVYKFKSKIVGRVEIECANCGKKLSRQLAQASKSTNYCDRNCQHEHWDRKKIYAWLHEGLIEYRTKNYGMPMYIKRYVHARDKNCVECGQTNEWNGKPLSLHVDHIDGRASNNRPENLRLLCPHCHSQTENFGSKNKNSDRDYKIWK
jgi:hypothetical protein